MISFVYSFRTILIVCCLIFVNCNNITESGNHSPYLSSCRQSDPEFEECIREEMSAAGPYLADGIPSLAIPPIEPLVIPKIILTHGNSVKKYTATLTNLRLHGLSAYKVDTLSINLQGMELSAKISIPLLCMESNYVVWGRALIVPITGAGSFTAILSDVIADANMNGRLIEMDGREYIDVQKTVVKLTVKEAKAQFIDTNDKSSLFRRVANEFMNKRSNDIINEVMPEIEKISSDLLHDICQKSFSVTPWDQLIPK